MSDRRNDSNDDRQDASPEQIEERIRSTQDDLRSDLDALEDKVSPDNLKRQAQERVDDTTDMIKEKAVDTTREAGEAVRDRIDDMTEDFRRGERMSTLSMLGLAAVIGIGLLLTRGSRHRDRYQQGRYAGSYGRRDDGARGYEDTGGYGRRAASYPQRY